MTPIDTWSTWEAKARFSELLRIVREGRTVTVTYHGEPVAEVRPLKRTVGIEGRLEHLRKRGSLSVPERPGGLPPALASRPGALARFLEDRNG